MDRVAIPVLDAEKFFVRKFQKIRAKTSTWIGRDASGEYTLLLTLGSDHFFGRLIGPEKEIVFRPGRDGSTVVSKLVDPRFEVPLIGDEVAAPRGLEEPYAAYDLPDDGTRLDMMVLYTNGMASAYPGSQIDTRIQNLIDQSNLALANSQIDTQLNLVYSQAVNYPDDSIGDMREALDDLTKNLGVFSNVETLRTLYGADQVTLLRQYVDEGCGMAWLLQATTDAGHAYSVVHDAEKTDNSGYYCSELTFVHEFGHNLGCQHDRANASVPGRFPYSYGYQDAANLFRTVMAYDCVGGCPRIPYFSNPELTYQGKPLGVPISSAEAAHNALTINSTRVVVAAYRATVVPGIRVLSPNGGESWNRGKTYPVTWTTSNLSSAITIELYQGGVLKSTLAANIADTGSFSWTVSPQLPLGADYSIRIRGDAAGGDVFDDSDNYFRIASSVQSKAAPWIDLLLLDP